MKDSQKHSPVSKNATADAKPPPAQAFGIPVLHAVLISLALVITLALYVGMWREKITRQDSELATLARQNAELAGSIAASKKHAAELRTQPASAKPEIPKTRQEAASASKP